MDVPSSRAITFSAIFGKVETTADGGWKIVLLCDQSQGEELLRMAECRESPLSVAVTPTDGGGDPSDALEDEYDDLDRRF